MLVNYQNMSTSELIERLRTSNDELDNALSNHSDKELIEILRVNISDLTAEIDRRSGSIQSNRAKKSQVFENRNTVQNIPKCPTCQSDNVKKISDVKRAVHGIAWGFLSKTAFSQFECKNCGYKW